MFGAFHSGFQCQAVSTFTGLKGRNQKPFKGELWNVIPQENSFPASYPLLLPCMNSAFNLI